MKKKALATRMAAFAMAGAMTMAMGFPALAAETDNLNVPFKKTINNVNSSPNKVKAPVTKFSFSVVPSEAITLKNGTESIYVYRGLDNGVSLEKEELSITAENTTGSVEGNVIVHKNIFGKPGVYHYLVSEIPTDPTYDGMGYTNLKYDLYVIVDANNAVSTIITKRESDKAQTDFANLNTGKAEEIEFVNEYTTKNLTVRKKVTGNQGDKSKEFTFNINVNGAVNEQYTYEIYDVNNEGTIQGEATSSGVLTSSGETKTQITLTDNQEVVIYGLSRTDSYTVSEESYAGEGYTTKVDGTVGSESSGTIDGDKLVIFENNKNITTPTGIITEYAPYILLVAAAGTFAVLFLRKRKEEF